MKRNISAPSAVQPPETSVKPAFDAPISAVNAGERRIMVRHNESVMSLAVTPSTTPVDIIRAAKDQSSEALDAESSVLMESFKQLGLERPLRRYEHVRDVMNSWDNDTSNTLVIMPSPTGGKDEDLDLKHVLSCQPGNTSAQIYHSQKPGSWDKRWITLRSYGQVLVAKKDGREALNICHLSDFDIYVPSARQLAKKIKPPRKFCFAVKSQQKSSMFLTTLNFVHFFSTSDQALATSWYKAVQEWRSWYLVNVMGEGQKEPSHNTLQANGVQRGISNRRPKDMEHQSRPSIDRGPSLQDHDVTRINGAGQTTAALPSHNIPMRNQGLPPMSPPKKLTKDAHTGAPTTRDQGPSIIQGRPGPDSALDPFASTGLLGRSYTQRQQAHRERQPINDASPAPVPEMQTASQSGGPKRASSSRYHKPKPLIDLSTPHYQEPLHHRKARTVTPSHLPPGGLVEAATTPHQPTPTPRHEPLTPTTNPSASTPHRTKTLRSANKNNNTTSSHPPEKPKPPTAFTGAGLLAGTDTSSNPGNAHTGQGVRTGDRDATAPLLELQIDSMYAPGSLLARAERRDGPGGGLVIDRQKWVEVKVGVGEGV